MKMVISRRIHQGYTGVRVIRSTMMRNNVFLLLLMLISSWLSSVKAAVTYDNKGLIIDGKKRILMSGSIHYPRSTPEVLDIVFTMCVLNFSWSFLVLIFSFIVWLQMWPDLLKIAKDGGIDIIQTYVFWSGHEPSPGKVMHLQPFSF